MDIRRFVLPIVSFAGVLAWAPTPALASPDAWFSRIAAFDANVTGAEPSGGLVADASGDLFGVLIGGGAMNAGVAYELRADRRGYTDRSLYQFGLSPTDGADPVGTPLMDASGNLYGVTSDGGKNGHGTVYRLSPTPQGYVETILHDFRFGTTDGSDPTGGLVADGRGDLFGTTYFGGSSGLGTVFELRPTGTAYTESVIYSFATEDAPTALALDAYGDVFGAASAGGSWPCPSNRGCGYVYALHPSGDAKAPYIASVLYDFKGGSDGDSPASAPIVTADGRIFGTTAYGGTGCSPPVGLGDPGCGTVYALVPVTHGYVKRTLVAFQGGADGAYPAATLLRLPSGTLVGTTSGDDPLAGSASNTGTIFALRPSPMGYTKTVLYHFFGARFHEGYYPSAGLTLGPSPGIVFGTTAEGGWGFERCNVGCGTAFELRFRA